MKTHTQVILDRSGAPEYVWLECAKWLADVHNVVADESLGWRSPLECRHGTTPDISAYIMFSFWEPVYYLEPTTPHPHSKELPARFLGVAENSGDALTFRILTENGSILVHSVIRSAVNPTRFGYPNQRVDGTSHAPCLVLRGTLF